MLSKILDFLRGGSRDFNEAEKRVLSFLSDSLSPEDKEILSKQLSKVRLVQRPSPGRMVVAYYHEHSDFPKFSYLGYEHCLANVSYKSQGKTRTTSLVLHDGHLMSIERNVPQKLSEIDILVKVVLHPSGFSSVTKEIDVKEHGRGPAK